MFLGSFRELRVRVVGGALVKVVTPNDGSEFGLDGTVRITVGPTPLMERAAAELAAVRDELLRARAPEPESRRAAGSA